MTGIADMFRELSEPDWFQLQFVFETQARLIRDANRRYEKSPARREYKRKWYREYAKQRRREDPQWAAKVRERQIAHNRAYRARKRAERMAA